MARYATASGQNVLFSWSKRLEIIVLISFSVSLLFSNSDCVGQSSEGFNIQQEVVCAGANASLSCPADLVIHLLSVTHGRYDNITCTRTGTPADVINVRCDQDGAGALFRQACDDRQSCDVTAEDIAATSTSCDDAAQAYVTYRYVCSSKILLPFSFDHIVFFSVL